jgi:DNA polymerase-3 subunit epsilon
MDILAISVFSFVDRFARAIDVKVPVHEGSLIEMAATLERHPDYRVLRRLIFRDAFIEANDQPTKTAVVVDVETTGLDPTSDEVIELGMVKFTYLPSGQIVRIVDTFSSLNEPTKQIPPGATKLHRITDDMVAGHRIDESAVDAFASDAAIVIAHNANFDRRFAERYWPVFVDKPWACSVSNVDWRAHGFEGSRLGYLLAGVGMFHEAHRAVDDCRALLEILARPMPTVERPALSLLLDSARKRTVRIWAEQSPFDLKDELKKRGYRWSSGEDGRPKAWYIDVDEDVEADEICYLREHIYRREVDLFTQVVTAIERYSVRV